MPPEVLFNGQTLAGLCRRYGVKELALFGSAARGTRIGLVRCAGRKARTGRGGPQHVQELVYRG
ncbi:MAG: hypothetical protein JNK48_03350 [Bryobacterales bacterium]|nr:hypothetical protein [Bryobacterales bacterium]